MPKHILTYLFSIFILKAIACLIPSELHAQDWRNGNWIVTEQELGYLDDGEIATRWFKLFSRNAPMREYLEYDAKLKEYPNDKIAVYLLARSERKEKNNYARAEQQLTRAANMGVIRAVSDLAEIYWRYTDGSEANLLKAKQLYSNAAQSGQPYSQYKYAMFLIATANYEKIGNCNEGASILSGIKEKIPPNAVALQTEINKSLRLVGEELQFIQNESEILTHGDGNILLMLARKYKYGNCRSINYYKALEIAELAALRGSNKAYEEIGRVASALSASGITRAEFEKAMMYLELGRFSESGSEYDREDLATSPNYPSRDKMLGYAKQVGREAQLAQVFQRVDQKATVGSGLANSPSNLNRVLKQVRTISGQPTNQEVYSALRSADEEAKSFFVVMNVAKALGTKTVSNQNTWSTVTSDAFGLSRLEINSEITETSCSSRVKDLYTCSFHIWYSPLKMSVLGIEMPGLGSGFDIWKTYDFYKTSDGFRVPARVVEMRKLINDTLSKQEQDSVRESLERLNKKAQDRLQFCPFGGNSDLDNKFYC